MPLVHLAVRFFGSLDPRPIPAHDDEWACDHLVPGEVALWRHMPRADRRHSIGVARDVARRLGDDATRPVLAAALLHDVGKIDSGLGTFARVFATLVSLVVGRSRAARGDGRVARYLRHDAVGADLLAAAGSDPLTATWAREHHLPPSAWSLDPRIADALHDADND